MIIWPMPPTAMPSVGQRVPEGQETGAFGAQVPWAWVTDVEATTATYTAATAGSHLITLSKYFVIGSSLQMGPLLHATGPNLLYRYRSCDGPHEEKHPNARSNHAA